MKTYNFLKVYGSLIVQTISTLLLGVGINKYTSQNDLDHNYWNIYAITALLGAALFIWGSVANLKRTKSYENNKKLLEQKAKELNEIELQNKSMYSNVFTTLYEILQRYLAYVVANELKEIITTSERVTVYAHDSKERGFRQIGRYSPNPIYNRRSTEREFYPENQGSINIAWTKGQCEIIVSDPSKYPEAYKNELINKYKFTENIVKVISMPSCLFIGYAIEDSKKNKIGVILFESEEIDRLKENKAQLQVIASDKHCVIQTLIEKENDLRKMFPYKH